MSYGRIRPLAETLRSIGLLPKKQQLVESKDSELVARKAIAAQVRNPAPAAKAPAPESKPVSATRQILEEIETLQREFRVAAEGSDVPADAKEILKNIGQFCESAIKRYGWRLDEKSQKLSKVFKLLKREAEDLTGKIDGGEIAESNEIKSSVRARVRLFAEAVRQVKGDFSVNESVLGEIEAKVK